MYIIETTRPSGKTYIDLDRVVGISTFEKDTSVTLYMDSGEKFHIENVDIQELIEDWKWREENGN